jgi:hypothetical protein
MWKLSDHLPVLSSRETGPNAGVMAAFGRLVQSSGELTISTIGGDEPGMNRYVLLLGDGGTGRLRFILDLDTGEANALPRLSEI